MNYIDATCRACRAVFSWLSGTPRVCNNCLAHNSGESLADKIMQVDKEDAVAEAERIVQSRMRRYEEGNA